MASKVIVIGDANSQFPAVFSKLTTLHSKNAFSLAIIVGNLFADPTTAAPGNDEAFLDSLLNGAITIPLPTYFSLGKHALPPRVIQKLESNAGELCSNLYFLGKRTTIKTSEGIRIVALGGTLDPNVTAGLSIDRYLPFYTVDDAKALKGANTADILVTNDWPSSIMIGSKVTFNSDNEEPTSQQCITELCAKLKPRYHFSTSSDNFYEREPFFHSPTEEASDSRPITRFLSLASYNNPSKQKWLYAFSLDPTAAPPSTLPPGTTASPLLNPTKKRRALPNREDYSRFSQINNHHRSNKRQRQPPPTPSECFFCLSNPNLATHLLTSIATDTYLTTARGPLSTLDTFPQLGFPAHILIIPLTHSPTLDSIADPTARKNTYKEMQRYKGALQTMLSEKANGELGAVIWEVARAGGIHIHWQFLPVAADLVNKGLVEAAFKVEAENAKYPKFETKDIGDGTGESNDFFRVWIWSPSSSHSNGGLAEGDANSNNVKGSEKCLILPLSSNFRFDLQFGRRVLAKLLQIDRFDWKECLQPQEDENADAEAFKQAFKEFDFSVEE
ncbi:MAG: hypothetical protein M1827_007143 [Pycnora praestabilis]|nr:MAG: hypothetical protein M1827_007143 [Pycnora praestabilis]